ncbi:MAG: 3-deoxy-7-phosphoheptulonate synthase [Ignavibacteriaceae bacterium]|nr:3-deoxy-7-phosphoheptulonate synthase [Ignavibacteriaceae bacterium]
MIVILDKSATDEQIENVIKQLEYFGFDVHKSGGDEYIAIGAIGVKPNFDIRKIQLLDGVVTVFRVTDQINLASRKSKKENTLIKVKDVTIGGNEVIVMSGPCSIENEDQIFKIAKIVKAHGAKILRGGAFKPRTSPYSFQGLGEEGLKYIRAAGDEFDLPVVTEVLEIKHLELVNKYADIFQVGSRNMQNFPLLRELGKTNKPVLLKRGFSATIEEWLMSAEYILSGGNENVILCERGIRTFETSTRNTFDLSAIPVVHQKSHLPVIADPSHAIGLRDKIIPMARAAIAADADGLLIEVHHDPTNALSDGPQALLPEQFSELMLQIKQIAEVIGRRIGESSVEKIL